jgi:carboxypeptidase family protein
MSLRKLAALAFLPLVATILLSPVAAQTNQGSIAGNVSDPSGAMVPNAKIVAKEKNTGSTYQTVSTSAGSYRFPNVNIGSYDITATAPGFKTATLTGVLVQVATTAALDIKLQTGTVTENVVVNADAPTVQTESADIGTVVTTKQILDLPLPLGSTVQNMRSPEAFAFLTPGVVGPGSDSGNGGTFESKITGGQNYATEVLLDGAATTRSENGSSFDETAPSVEALGEFKILTSTIPAEFGRTTGGIESFNTKSGTNGFHGNLYELFRNEDLDANVWGNDYMLKTQNLSAAERRQFETPLDRQNDYGGTLGGPVVIPHLYNGRDKTFFFFSWEQYRQTQGGVSTSTVPTNAMRNGDFSAILGPPITVTVGNAVHPVINPCDGSPILVGQIFDPSTTDPVKQCRTAFPGNQFSPTSTVGQNILSFYPAPQTGALTNNYNFSFSIPILDTTTTFRIDQNITENDKAYFTYSSRENTRNSTTPVFAGPAGYARTQFFGTHYLRLGYDHTFGPSLLNHLNLGYNRTNSKNVGAGIGLGKGQDFDQTLGIGGGASGLLFPSITQTNATNLGDNVDGDTIDNGFRFNDTLNWIKGKHEFKFGYEQWYQQYSPIDFSNTSGTFGFTNNQTATFGVDPLGANPTASVDVRNQTGDSIASMLLGVPDNGSYAVIKDQARFLRSYFAGFIQDNYKVTPNLTLNLGFRYEVDQPFKEANDNMSELSLTAPNCNSFTPVCPTDPNLAGALVFAGKGAGRNGITGERWAETYMKNFGPRIGFAYSPSFLGAGKTVFRGGYGIIYGGLQYADFGGHGRQGFRGTAGQFSNGFSPAFTLDTGMTVTPPTVPNFDPSQVNFQGCCVEATILPSYGRPPMTQNWSFEVQRELMTDMILDIAYVGQHSQNLRTNYDGENIVNPKYFSLGSDLTQPASCLAGAPPPAAQCPKAIAAGVKLPYASFPGDQLLAQAVLPFPQFFGINTDGQLENLGQSTYNALEAQLTRRFHNGLNLMASYTWSKTLTNADAALPFFATLHQGGAPSNFFDQRADKSVSNQDLPQNLVVSYLYELPVGRGKHFLGNSHGVVDRLLGGWQIGGIQRYESGQPISFGCATAPPAFGECIRFDQVPGSSILSDAFKSDHWNPITDPIFNPIDLPNVANPTKAAFHDPNSGSEVASRGTYVFGNTPRVFSNIRMKPYLSEDFSFIKRTKLTEKTDLNFQLTMINAFNRHIWNRPLDLNPYDSQVTSGAFGLMQITNFSNLGGGSYLLLPRKIQLQLKLEF